MKCFTSWSNRLGINEPGEFKAVVFAALACFLFLGFLTVTQRSVKGRHQREVKIRIGDAPPIRQVPVPELSEVAPPPTPSAPDRNERYREVPASFKRIDFRNRSYGNYMFQDGRYVDLTMTAGQYGLFVDVSHWFTVRDVFYTDLTGDRRPEAIVRMSHLRCRQSSDGVADLFYAYTLDQGALREIWQFETGTWVYGCGLKTFTTKDQQIEVELFGSCTNMTVSSVSQPHVVDMLTRLDFRYDGERFVSHARRLLPLPAGKDVHYETQIRIAEDVSESISRKSAGSEQLRID